MKKYTYLCLIAILLISQVGCESMRSVIVDFEVNSDVRILPSEKLLNLAPITYNRIQTKKLTPFSDSELITPDLRILTYSSSTFLFSFEIENLGSKKILANRARMMISSNFAPHPKPLECWQAKDLKQQTAPINEMRELPFKISCTYPKMHLQYPNGNIFNAKWDKSSGKLLDSGGMNEIYFHIPVSVDGKEATLIVTFTSTKAALRFSYA